MGFQLSPGVNVSEIDLTTVVPAVGTTTGAIAGPFQWGPAGKRVLIDSELYLAQRFGKPDNYTANTWWTAANFLNYTNALQVVRCVTTNHRNAVSDPTKVVDIILLTGGSGYPSDGPNALTITGGGGHGAAGYAVIANGIVQDVVLTEHGGGYTSAPTVSLEDDIYATPATFEVVLSNGVLIKNDDQYLAQYAGGQGSHGMWAAKYPGSLGNSLLVSVADVNSFATWEYKDAFDGPPNTSAMVEALGGSNDEIHVVVVDDDGYWTGVKGTVLERHPYLSKCAEAKTEDGSSMYYPEVINRVSQYIWWMDHPTGKNWGGTLTTDFDTLAQTIALTTPSGTFSVGETVQFATSVALTPPGSGAIGKVATIGGSGDVTAITMTNGGTRYSGRVNVTCSGAGSSFSGTATIVGGVITGVSIVGAGTGYSIDDPLVFTPSGSGATATATISADGVITAITVTNAGSGYTASPTVVVTGPGTGFVGYSTLAANPGGVAGVVVQSGGGGWETISATVLGWSTPNLTIKPLVGQFLEHHIVTGLTSGAHGLIDDSGAITGGVLTYSLTGGVDDNEHVDTQETIIGYDEFRSGEEVDVSLIMGCDANATIALHLISIAEYRKDCVVFLSPPRAAVVNNAGNETDAIVAFREILPSTSYAFMDSGWKYGYDKYNDVYRWMPLNGDIAGLAARTDEQRDPWWSFAGLNRGQIKSSVRLAWNPRKAYRDILYKNGVNPVVSFIGEGTVLYGDKTLLAKPSAFDRINVRRLFIVIEKAIASAAKYTLFEFNDKFTRAQFVNLVEPYLRDVQGRRGIYDFRVVCDETNNTPERIDRNEFWGDIYVKPARSINFIQLNFIAVRTGVSFDEIVGKF